MFCRDGVHATGIDRILAASGASKMTLYSRFGSKEALLREVLVREGEAVRSVLLGAIRDSADTPAGRLRQVIPALALWFGQENFTGCAFMNAIAEYTKGEPWLRDLARTHHRLILNILETEAAAAGCEEPDMLARQILLVIDGAIAATMVSGDPKVLQVSARNLDSVLAQAGI